ncbi:MAG: MFS transporter [Anaerolineae bacterium]|nr:MFS transporter [Anaerolineae bacterium]
MTGSTSPARTLWGFTSQFWILVVGTLINSTGSALVFPFIALYIGRRFNVTELEVGGIFTLYAVVSLLSGAAGGAVTDRFGRKVSMIIGLASAIIFSVILAFADSLNVILLAIVINGLLSPVFGPASNAMVADMLPVARRARGYGLIRVAANLGVVIGPLFGGFLADQEGGFLVLFIGDAITSGIFALLIAFFIRETSPQRAARPAAAVHRRWLDSLKLFEGYGQIVRDVPFILFALTFLGSTLVYSQMNTNLPLFMDSEGFTASQYSTLIALNAAMVVFLQFPITAYIERFRHTRILAFGAVCYGIGFGMFGGLSQMWWFAIGMAILTVGEMVVVPVAQTVVAEMAPEDMRGRYMGFYGLTWGLSFAIGPLLGGMILSAEGGAYRVVLWQAALIVGLLGAGAFLVLGRYLKRRAAQQRWAEVMARYSIDASPGARQVYQAAAAGTPIIPGAASEG